MDYEEIEEKIKDAYKLLDEISAMSSGRYKTDIKEAKKYLNYCMEDADEKAKHLNIMWTSGDETVVYRNMDEVLYKYKSATPKQVRRAIKSGTLYMQGLWDYC